MVAVEPLCIPALLDTWAERQPDAPAIAALGCESMSFGHLEQHMRAMVRALGALGLDPQQRVALVLPNGPEMAVAALCVTSGAICLPLNPAYSEREFDFYFAALRPMALIAQEGIETPAHDAARDRGMRIIDLIPTSHSAAGSFTLHGETPTQVPPPALAKPADLALMLHTSGTTSQPKIVPLTHAHICHAAANLSADLALTTADRCLNLVPLFHTYGLVAAVLTALISGGSAMCLDGFAEDLFFTSLATFKPTWYQGVPAMHQAILTHIDSHPNAVAAAPLRFIRTGSAPTHDRVRSGLELAFRATVIEGYGMVEASGPVTCNPPSWGRYKPGSIGPSVGPEVAIIDACGTPLPAGTNGEIAVRGTSVIQGYENDAEINREAFIGEWFRSGDAGYMDADGYVFLTGRLKEMINRGGEKIAPQEVDNALLEHSEVVQAAAFAVPHVQLGEDVAAAVVLSPEATVTSGDLRRFAAARLAAYKVPQQVFIVPSIPSAATGLKPQRRELARRLGLLVAEAGTSRSTAKGMEAVLTQIWQEILSVSSIGPHDNFFALGGHSLLATQVISRLRDATQIDLVPRVLFDHPTLAELAVYLEAEPLRQQVWEVRLQPRPQALHQVPATLTQEQLWLFDQIFPNTSFFTIPYVLHLRGTLNHQALTQAFSHLIERHEALRTIFETVAGEVVQIVRPVSRFDLPVEDLSSLAPSVQDRRVEQRIEDEIQRPFDLSVGPLLRAYLVRHQSQAHILIITLHHIMSDGWSLGILARELATVYDALVVGQPPSLMPLPVQFADYAHWQQQRRQHASQAAQLKYWTQQLGGPLDWMPLHIDRPRQSALSFSTARQPFEVAAPVSQALTPYCREVGCSPFMGLVAALKVLLSRETGSTDIRVGTIVANRQPSATEALIGLLTNTLVLRTQLDGNPTYREVLQRVRETTLAAYAHQALPFEVICQALEASTALQPAVLCQVLLILQPARLRPLELPCQTLQIREIDPSLTESRFPPMTADLVLMLREHVSDATGTQAPTGTWGLTGSCIYKTSLYNPETISRFIQNFQDTLSDILTKPETQLDV